jgi:hypothetical protein
MGIFFYDQNFWDCPPTACEVLVYVLDSGTEKSVNSLLREAMEAWDREFAARGL